jgi:plastocyanin
MGRLLLVVALLVMPALLAAPAEAANVAVGNGSTFTPSSTTVVQGDTVTWDWVGPDTNHSVTSDPGQAESFDSDPTPPLTGIDHPKGFTFAHTFSQLGSFSYVCRVHSFMTGKVRVVPPGTDIVAPKISGLRADPSKLCSNKSKKCAHPGTVIRFSLPEAARIQAKISPKGMSKTVKSFKLNGVAGKNKPKYSARGLKPGDYVLKLTPTDFAGNAGNTKTTKLTVRK